MLRDPKRRGMTDWATGEGERERPRGVVVRSLGVTLQGDDKCLAGIPIDARGRDIVFPADGAIKLT